MVRYRVSLSFMIFNSGGYQAIAAFKSFMLPVWGTSWFQSINQFLRLLSPHFANLLIYILSSKINFISTEGVHFLKSNVSMVRENCYQASVATRQVNSTCVTVSITTP